MANLIDGTSIEKLRSLEVGRRIRVPDGSSVFVAPLRRFGDKFVGCARAMGCVRADAGRGVYWLFVRVVSRGARNRANDGYLLLRSRQSFLFCQAYENAVLAGAVRWTARETSDAPSGALYHGKKKC